jgi:hypothetical protein
MESVLDLIRYGATRCSDNCIATKRRCPGGFLRLYMMRCMVCKLGSRSRVIESAPACRLNLHFHSRLLAFCGRCWRGWNPKAYSRSMKSESSGRTRSSISASRQRLFKWHPPVTISDGAILSLPCTLAISLPSLVLLLVHFRRKMCEEILKRLLALALHHYRGFLFFHAGILSSKNSLHAHPQRRDLGGLCSLDSPNTTDTFRRFEVSSHTRASQK